MSAIELGNRTNLTETQVNGRRAIVRMADQHTVNVLPVIREIQDLGARTLRATADALNARGIKTE